MGNKEQLLLMWKNEPLFYLWVIQTVTHLFLNASERAEINHIKTSTTSTDFKTRSQMLCNLFN